MPGVYQMFGKDGQLLYVGKAKSLKNRVANYAAPGGMSYRIQMMVSQTCRMEFIIASSEAEAFLIENNLIKEKSPKFNILLKDDKSYPYIALDKSHEFPRIFKYRGAKRAGVAYFGPFTNAGEVGTTITLLQKAFLLRSCTDAMLRNRARPCLLYQIKRCCAPCTGLISAPDYAALVARTRDFMNGAATDLQDELRAAMTAASGAQNYEAAAEFRDRLAALNSIQLHATDNMRGLDNHDIVGWAEKSGLTAVHVLFIRAAKLVGGFSFVGESQDNFMPEFLGQFYLKFDRPREVILAAPIPEQDLVSVALKVPFSVAERGGRRALAAQANLNASESLTRRLASGASFAEGMRELSDFCGFPVKRVEIYDNSHIQGTSAVGALVVATDEGFDKKSYRRFNLDTPGVGGDDPASMREVLARRQKYGDFPDLFLLDGGQAQMAVGQEVLGAAAPILALAESEPPVVYIAGRRILAEAIPRKTLLFLERLRDEAHRFAVGSNRARRARRDFDSELDKIPGIGQARRRALLAQFGSVRGVKGAGLAELASVAGIGQGRAKKLYEFFHG
ncbi:UvrABC system protein C [Alphaproteobacteria bacterium]|nr:UvrABC system protein C [Alphaproteobacteria bacterium]